MSYSAGANARLLEHVDAINLDVEALQVSFHAMVRKINAIKMELGKTNEAQLEQMGTSCQEAFGAQFSQEIVSRSAKELSEFSGDCVKLVPNSALVNTLQSAAPKFRSTSPAVAASKPTDTSANLGTPLMPIRPDFRPSLVAVAASEPIENSITGTATVSVPASLFYKWPTVMDKMPETGTLVGRMSGWSQAGMRKPKQLRWDSRWQDLFDSNDQEANDDEPVQVDKSSWVIRETLAKQVRHLQGPASCMVHPHSRFRVIWDLLGLLLIIYDAITIPIYTAWEIEMGALGFSLLLMGIVYWSADVVLSFCTGYFEEATLVFSRRAIAKHYIQSWFLADIFLISLDLFIAALPGASDGGGYLFRSIRVVRILRLARGLRLFKMSKIFLTAEEFFNTFGGNFVIMTFAVVKTLGSIYLIAHVAACAWYFIGQTQRKVGPSWVETIPDFDEAELVDQYIRSCYWVLGHLAAAPVDPTVHPMNGFERFFSLCLIFLSLLVLGVSISKMSATVAAINRENADASETKRKIQSYLHANSFPADLSVRVVRHALEVHKKRSAMTLDTTVLGLLSAALVSEINAWQRGKYLQQHPLFALIWQLHPEVIVEVYSACVPAVYADGDLVYKVGTISEVLFITVDGTYGLHHSPDLGRYSEVQFFETTQFFCEVSLFAQFFHDSTLKAVTFADSLSIHGADFVQCIRLMPSCIGTMYRYARVYVSKLVEVSPMPPGVEPAIKDGKIVVQDVMPIELAEEACEVARGANLPPLQEFATPSAEANTVRDTLACIMDEDLSTVEIVAKLELAFPEVHGEDGLYARMGEPQERRRSLGAMLGLILLHKGQYSLFVESQKQGCMTYELWREWQRFVQWTAASRETMHALLVLLCIRGIGKVKSIVKMVPPSYRTPENTVIYLMETARQAIPSVAHLSDEMSQLLLKVFDTHRKFNLAQLMQGENTPYQVLALKECIETQGETLLQFYLLALVGMMCGLTGDTTLQGCLFMNESNARNVLSCIECLQQLKDSQPHAIYWSYISRRAALLDLPVNSHEELTIARLVCLTRASKTDCIALKEVWASLDSYEKDILVDHFLADGIQERALLLSFLPVYLVNARNNRVVGLHRGLLVLIDLIVLLQADGMINHLSDTMTVVNLSDIASFTNEAINSLAFESLACHANVMLVNGEIRVTVSTKHWQASSHDTWRPDAINEIAHEVKRIRRKTRSVEALVKQFSNQANTHTSDDVAAFKVLYV